MFDISSLESGTDSRGVACTGSIEDSIPIVGAVSEISTVVVSCVEVILGIHVYLARVAFIKLFYVK
jgi:hypothetical protein